MSHNWTVQGTTQHPGRTEGAVRLSRHMQTAEFADPQGAEGGFPLG